MKKYIFFHYSNCCPLYLDIKVKLLPVLKMDKKSFRWYEQSIPRFHKDPEFQELTVLDFYNAQLAT